MPTPFLGHSRPGGVGACSWEAAGGGVGGDLDAGAVAEFGEDVADVAFDGAGAEVEGGGDFGVGVAGGDELCDFLFAGAERAAVVAAAAGADAERAGGGAGVVGGAVGAHLFELVDGGE